MPKLDPDDEGQHPTSADVAVANASKAPTLFSATAQSAPDPTPAPTPAPVMQTQAPAFNSPPQSSFNAPSFGGGYNNGFGGGYNNGNQYSNNVNINQSQGAGAATANAFGGVMAAEAASGAPPEHWMQKFWRPAMGWLYMLICFADFVAFPLISMFLPIIERGFGVQIGYTAWQSLTLSNGGLIHLAFGAILGVSAYGRTQEKKAGTA
jgi:hypothetical protein